MPWGPPLYAVPLKISETHEGVIILGKVILQPLVLMLLF